MNALRRAAQRALSTGERSRLFGASRAFAAKANACPHDPAKPYHKSPLPLEAAGGLLEYSVVYTDRAMNHMSKPFCKVRRRISGGYVTRDNPGTRARARTLSPIRAITSSAPARSVVRPGRAHPP
jgi:hypothetical protein